MGLVSRFALSGAAASLAIAPAQAAELPNVPVPVQADYAVQTVLDDGDMTEYRGRHRYRRYRYRSADASEVLAGVLIIGGIFAVANAISKKDRYDRNDRDYVSNDDFDRAVDSCVERIERQQRVGSVENVGRTRDGYSVSGTLFDGSAFSCQVSGTGRVIDVDYGFGGVAYQSGGDVYGDDQQYSDETYARARAETFSGSNGYGQPAYPGGPVPGEDYADYEEGYQDGEPY